MSKITKSQRAQGLIIALINLTIEAGYNLDGAFIALEDIEDPAGTDTQVPFRQLVNETLTYLESLDKESNESTESEFYEQQTAKKT